MGTFTVRRATAEDADGILRLFEDEIVGDLAVSRRGPGRGRSGWAWRLGGAGKASERR